MALKKGPESRRSSSDRKRTFGVWKPDIKAGIFTIAVNTGPLDGQVLLDAGADLLFPSMQALLRWIGIRFFYKQINTDSIMQSYYLYLPT